MDKASSLKRLKNKILKDSPPLAREGINLVFGIGDPNSKIVFIGEAPGAKENELSQPFVGRSGKLLDKMLLENNLKRENVYITNIVKHRPPENRDPSPDEISAYSPYLTKELEIIQPKVIATLGRFSMNYFLRDAKISDAHGKPYKIKDFIIFPLYHPAAAMRSTKLMQTFREDFLNLSKIL